MDVVENKKFRLTFSYSINRRTNSLRISFYIESIHQKFHHFSLIYFLKDNHLEEKFNLEFNYEISIDLFFENFFKELAIGFNTYLKDQITGKEFNNHYSRIMDSFLNDSGVYLGLVETVHEYKMDYNSTLFEWLWWKLKSLILSLFKIK